MPLSQKQQIGAVILEDLLASGTIRSCLNCIHFSTIHGMPITCNHYNVPPPCEIIQSGCDQWEDDIPF